MANKGIGNKQNKLLFERFDGIHDKYMNSSKIDPDIPAFRKMYGVDLTVDGRLKRRKGFEKVLDSNFTNVVDYIYFDEALWVLDDGKYLYRIDNYNTSNPSKTLVYTFSNTSHMGTMEIFDNKLYVSNGIDDVLQQGSSDYVTNNTYTIVPSSDYGISICYDGSSKYYIGTSNGDIYVYDGGDISLFYKYFEPVPITAIAVTTGYLYFAANKYCYCLNLSNLTATIINFPDTACKTINYMHIAYGHLWVACNNNVLYRVSLGTNTATRINLSSITCDSIEYVVDDGANVWLTTSGSGTSYLIKISDPYGSCTVTNLGTPHTSINSIRYIYVDSSVVYLGCSGYNFNINYGWFEIWKYDGSFARLTSNNDNYCGNYNSHNKIYGINKVTVSGTNYLLLAPASGYLVYLNLSNNVLSIAAAFNKTYAACAVSNFLCVSCDSVVRLYKYYVSGSSFTYTYFGSAINSNSYGVVSIFQTNNNLISYILPGSTTSGGIGCRYRIDTKTYSSYRITPTGYRILYATTDSSSSYWYLIMTDSTYYYAGVATITGFIRFYDGGVPFGGGFVPTAIYLNSAETMLFVAGYTTSGSKLYTISLSSLYSTDRGILTTSTPPRGIVEVGNNVYIACGSKLVRVNTSTWNITTVADVSKNIYALYLYEEDTNKIFIGCEDNSNAIVKYYEIDTGDVFNHLSNLPGGRVCYFHYGGNNILYFIFYRYQTVYIYRSTVGVPDVYDVVETYSYYNVFSCARSRGRTNLLVSGYNTTATGNILSDFGVVQTILQDSATTTDDTPCFPHARFMIAFENMMCAFVVGDSGNIVSFSEPGDPTNWNNNQNFVVVGRDDDVLRGAVVMNRRLYLATDRAWFYGTYAPDVLVEVKELTRQYGCSSPLLMTAGRNEFYFVFNNEMYMFNGSSFYKLTEEIADFNPTNIEFCNDKVYGGDYVFHLDAFYQKRRPFTNITNGSGALYMNVADELFKIQSGDLYKVSSTAYEPVLIETNDLNELYDDYVVLKVYVDGVCLPSATYVQNLDSDAILCGTETVETQIQRFIRMAIRQANYIRVKLYSNDTTTNFELRRFGIIYLKKGRKGTI